MDFGPDLFNNLQYASDVFAELRARDPVRWTTDSGGYWAVTRSADIVEVSKNWTVFSSALEHGGITVAGDIDPGILRDSASMITSDPPDHVLWRRLFAPSFSSAFVAKFEATVRTIVDDVFDQLDDVAEGDWAEMVGTQVPARVMSTLLGIPPALHGKLCEWAMVIDGQDDPAVVSGGLSLGTCIDEMTACGLEIWQRAQLDQTGELVRRMIEARNEGTVISEGRFLAMFAMFIIAGAETVRNCIIGGLEALHTFPDQLELLRRQPELLDQTVREINRWVTPILHFRRTAMRDTILAGRAIRRGDRVVLWYFSANHDETLFAQPRRFDILRNGVDNLAFGAGQHRCIGWRLAEIELKSVFAACLRRLPRLRVMERGQRLRSNFINGYTRLTVRPHG